MRSLFKKISFLAIFLLVLMISGVFAQDKITLLSGCSMTVEKIFTPNQDMLLVPI
jgi:hypothetical protein